MENIIWNFGLGLFAIGGIGYFIAHLVYPQWTFLGGLLILFGVSILLGRFLKRKILNLRNL